MASSWRFGVALLAIVAVAQQGHHSDLLLLLCGGAWAAVVAAGWYLRVLDARQVEQASRSATRNASPSPASCTTSSPIT